MKIREIETKSVCVCLCVCVVVVVVGGGCRYHTEWTSSVGYDHSEETTWQVSMSQATRRLSAVKCNWASECFLSFKNKVVALDVYKRKKAARVELRMRRSWKKLQYLRSVCKESESKYLPKRLRRNAKDKRRPGKNLLTKQQWAEMKRILMLYAWDAESRRVNSVCIGPGTMFKALLQWEWECQAIIFCHVGRLKSAKQFYPFTIIFFFFSIHFTFHLCPCWFLNRLKWNLPISGLVDWNKSKFSVSAVIPAKT